MSRLSYIEKIKIYDIIIAMEKPDYDKIYEEIKLRGKDILYSAKYHENMSFIQHGSITVFQHCLSVAMLSVHIANVTGWKIDRTALIRGALLHDYFLYDWHEDAKWHRLHGYTHALRSMKNAQHDFGLNRVERNMIFSHMFPLNLTHLPLYKESWILCVADKVCGSIETAKYKKK